MRLTLLPACVLFLLLANLAPSQPPAGAKKKDRTFILDYRVRLDAGAPSSFLVKDAAPQIKRADLKTDATDAERTAFEQLIDAIEKLQVNGVLFTATGELEKGVLRLKGLPIRPKNFFWTLRHFASSIRSTARSSTWMSTPWTPTPSTSSLPPNRSR